MGDMVLNVPGRHNVLNALATTAVADACGLPFEGIASAMSHFHGAKRRFQTKGFVGDVWVVDDYAHHPTEINATLTAARDMGTHRVVCLFQPHRYTRTKLLLDQYGSAFAKLISSSSPTSTVPVKTPFPACRENSLPGRSRKRQGRMSPISRIRKI